MKKIFNILWFVPGFIIGGLIEISGVIFLGLGTALYSLGIFIKNPVNSIELIKNFFKEKPWKQKSGGMEK